MDNSRCNSCGVGFTETDRVVYCPKCNAYYHESCWTKNNGCVNPACEAYVGARADAPETINDELDPSGAIFDLKGARGRRMLVFEDRIVIKVRPCFGAFISMSLTYGEKTFYFKDVLGIQFKRPGFFLGYLYLETAAPRENRRMFSPNSFCYQFGNATMEKVYAYVKEKVAAFK